MPTNKTTVRLKRAVAEWRAAITEHADHLATVCPNSAFNAELTRLIDRIGACYDKIRGLVVPIAANASCAVLLVDGTVIAVRDDKWDEIGPWSQVQIILAPWLASSPARPLSHLHRGESDNGPSCKF
jgi:hypothetical protein